ncbi:MAG: T9SS type A sorting domain-containing protein [Chitinophagaceae bacterium]|nr:T9SS type A sorting domain-containing protein [Chitinophagaceae bacterium]
MQFPLATTAPQQLWSENAGAITRVFFDYTYGSIGPVATGTFSWTPPAGLSSTTSNPVAASPMTTTTYTVNVDNGAGCIRQANITITVNDRPVVTTQPTSVSSCNGSAATFTVAGTGTGLSYQWQVSTTGPGGPWTNLANAAPYSGVTTATLTINPVSLALSGNNYRAVLSGSCAPVGTANISNAVVLTVNALPVVTVTPTSGCGGVAGINGLLLTASGATSYTWAPLTGLYTNATATIPYTGGNSATVYAAPTAFTAYTVTGTSSTTGCSNTATALINYTPPAPTVVPSSVTMCLGDPAVKLKSSSATSSVMAFNSGVISVPIPDNSQAGASHNLTVSGIPANATVTGMKVKMTIPHTFIGDLVIALKAPNNNVLNLDFFLSNSFGGVTTGFLNTVITSAAGAPALSTGSNPYTASFRPDGQIAATGNGPAAPTGYTANMANFNALISTLTPANVNGVYTLAMYDGGAIDIGTLTNWEIEFTYVQGVPATPAVWSPAAGLFSDALATVPYVAGTAVDSVWTRPTPSGVYPYQVTVQSLGLPPTAIQTTFTNNNQFALVTTNFRNNNAFPVTISGFESIASTSGASVATLFYKTTPVNGAPGAISAANGWNVAGTGPYTAIANTTTTTPQPMLSGLSLVIPAGATYGLAFQSTTAALVGNLRYSTVAAGTYINSGGGCDVIAGSNASYAGGVAPIAPLNTPRAFIGRVLFGNNTTPCTSPARTVVVTVNQPTTLNAALPANQTICTDKVATFTVAVTAGTGPHSYQWQVSTDNGNTWTNIANGGVYSGVTTATLTVTAPPVSMSGYQYHAIVNGAAPCAASTSRNAILTVNPLPTVVITASPYTSLFPGMVTTISSTVTPNAAATYTWLRNGVVVAGAVTGTITVDIDGLGDYQLRVNDVNGCSNVSNIITIKDSVSAKCFIYPNPTSGKFQVRYYSVANNVLPRTLTIYDAKGDRVFTQYYTIGRPYDRMDVDMRAYGKGMYWVEIGDLNGNRLSMCRVVIQ